MKHTFDSVHNSNRVMRGLIAAPYTPFCRKTGDLDLTVVERYAQSLVSAGVGGAFICGTTGEGVSLTIEERFRVAERWVAVSDKSLKVIVHVGDLSQRNAMTLAAHACKVGAAAVAAMPSFFFKPANLGALIDFCKPIAAAAGDLPFFYYHIPSMNGVTCSMLDFMEAATKQIPNFRGVKFTHGDMMEYTRCLRAFGDTHEIAWGVDEMLLGAMAVGARAAVGSTYNYAAPLYQKLIRAFQGGDAEQARELASQSCEMISVLLRNGVLRTGKATMSMIGIDCGNPRSPISPLTNEEYAAIRIAYERMNVIALENPAQRGRIEPNELPASI